MKKLICLLLSLTFALGCASASFTVFADEEDAAVDTESVESVDAADTESYAEVPDDETVGGESDESEAETEVTSDAESETASDAWIGAASDAESELPVGTNAPKKEEVIVSYASETEELPDIGWLVWTVCGLLLVGCLVIFAYKLIQYRNSR